MRAAAIGECMVEFHRRPDGSYGRGFGGDTLNVALYLARLGIPTDYVTMLGDDPLSQEMVDAWAAEGVGTGLVGRVPGKLPGLYLIETDAVGERTFHYWRTAAAARDLIARAGDRLAAALAGRALVYLSGITLALYPPAERDRLLAVLDRLRAGGTRIAFDGNYRPRQWPDQGAARAAFAAMLHRVDVALPTFDDEARLFGDAAPEATVARLRAAGVAEIAVKRGAAPCLVSTPTDTRWVPVGEAITPVDTTAAGDSFNAGYLAARLRGLEAPTAAAHGHRLATRVIGHPGAIIPRAAMPDP